VSRADRYEDLSAYLDGELPDAQRAQVERLLASDPDARAILEDLRRVSTLTGSLPRRNAPADTDQRVLARLEREALLAGESPRLPVPPLRTWRGLALAASLAIFVIAGLYLRPELESKTSRIAPREEQLAVRTEPARPVPPPMTLSKDEAPGVGGRSAGESPQPTLLADSSRESDEAEDQPMALAKAAPRAERGFTDSRLRRTVAATATSQPTSQPTSKPTSQPASQPSTGKSP
jgi:anti-sigma factor RsiW